MLTKREALLFLMSMVGKPVFAGEPISDTPSENNPLTHRGKVFSIVDMGKPYLLINLDNFSGLSVAFGGETVTFTAEFIFETLKEP